MANPAQKARRDPRRCRMLIREKASVATTRLNSAPAQSAEGRCSAANPTPHTEMKASRPAIEIRGGRMRASRAEDRRLRCPNDLVQDIRRLGIGRGGCG